MELSFNGGKFVSLEGDLNYREVLNDFHTAKTIRIITYNISKNQRFDALLNSLKTTDADIQIISNVPSRMGEYYNSPAGDQMRSRARKNIQIYIDKLNPDNFPSTFKPFFNVHNHAKLIGTENIVYIGSANFSNESADNIEAGILIEDKTFIRNLYAEFFDRVREKSLSYLDEEFSVFRLFVLSLYAKFDYHHKKLLQDLYTSYQRSKLVVSDTVFLDVSDLDNLYRDIDELSAVRNAAEDTYDDDDEDYNAALNQLKDDFNSLSIDWLKDLISEDGTLYQLVAFDEEGEANTILQEDFSAEAYDEHLDEYTERSMNMAAEKYAMLRDDFCNDADDFLSEIEKILSALSSAICFTDEWKASKVNPEIDNTQ